MQRLSSMSLFLLPFLVLVEGIYLTVFGKSISLNSRRQPAPDPEWKRAANREQVLEQLRKEMGQHMGRPRVFPCTQILANKAQKANIAFSPKALIGIMAQVLSVFSSLALTVGDRGSRPRSAR